MAINKRDVIADKNVSRRIRVFTLRILNQHIQRWWRLG